MSHVKNSILPSCSGSLTRDHGVKHENEFAG